MNLGLELICMRSDNPSMARRRKGYVYILASKKNGTLYVGITSNLIERVHEHKNEIHGGFTSKYGVKTLVWYEEHDLITDAIAQEKRIKRWRRQWKIDLIEAHNPDWLELEPPD